MEEDRVTETVWPAYIDAASGHIENPPSQPPEQDVTVR